jgi:hypothetical protein
MAAIGPYSRDIAAGILDRRTKVARRFEQIIADLTAHAGGDQASVAARILIRRVAIDLMQLEQLDMKFAAAASGTGAWTDHDARTSGGLRGGRSAWRSASWECGSRSPRSGRHSLRRSLSMRGARHHDRARRLAR